MAAPSPSTAIEVLVVGDRVVFDLRKQNGEPALILLFQVVPAGESTPMWQLAPIGAERRYSTGATLSGTAGPSEAHEFDAHLKGASREYGVAVHEIESGVVPEGLQQFVPDVGSPSPLAPGHRYGVQLIADGYVAMTFEV